MMNKELPQPAEKWRHFKGGEYWVLAIAFISRSLHPTSSQVQDLFKQLAAIGKGEILETSRGIKFKVP